MELHAGDGVVLRGMGWKGGSDGVMLLHDRGEDIDSMIGMAIVLSNLGFTVHALDRRGHGTSDGIAHSSEAEDASASLDRLRLEATTSAAIVAIGASAVDALTLRRASQVVAVVLISPDAATLECAPIQGIAGAPVHIVVGGHDAASAHVADAVRKMLLGYCAVARIPTHDQGSRLLVGETAPLVTEQIGVFLARHRH